MFTSLCPVSSLKFLTYFEIYRWELNYITLNYKVCEVKRVISTQCYISNEYPELIQKQQLYQVTVELLE